MSECAELNTIYVYSIIWFIVATNEEQMLEQALAMSMDARPGAAGRVPDFSAMSEEEQIEYAMQMSMQEHASKNQLFLN